MSHRRAWIAAVVLAVLAAGSAGAQDRRDRQTPVVSGGRTVIELQPAEEKKTEPPKPVDEERGVLIGMEAYREVLQTGRYLVGPGDRFLVHVSDMEEPAETVVLAEGGLFLPRVGRVQVGGLRLSEARAAVDSAFAEAVRVGRIYVELLAPRSFPVTVVGLVERPGVVVGSGVERVSEVLQRAGGLAPGASTRNILLVRSTELTPEELASLRSANRLGLGIDLQGRSGTRRVDLGLFEATGRSALNPFLQDGDIVVVPSQRHLLQATEQVRRPGRYEFVRGDRLSDLAALAMGPSAKYDPANAFLFRYDDNGTRQTRQAVDLDAALAGDLAADVTLEPGDWLVVRARPEFQRESTVEVIGEVVYPGDYVVAPRGTPLQGVLDQAGGVTEKASLVKARVVRKLEEEEEERDPEFERILSIPPSAWDEDERQYFNMRSREKRGELVVDFVALAQGDSSQNVLLRPGDVVVVPRSLQTVLVSGQAAYPGAVPYDEAFGVDEYIARAGGFGWRAADDVRVIKARTGEIREAEEVDKIEPGDNIWIKEEPVRDYWAIFTQSVQVAGQVATVLLLFVTVLQ